MATRRAKVTCHFLARLSREGELWVSECIGLPVVSQGENDNEALSNLLEAVHLFIDTAVKRDTLTQVLLKYNWRPTAHPQVSERKNEVPLPIRIPPHIAKQLLECHA